MKRQQSDIALSIMVTSQKQIQTIGDIIGTEQGGKKSIWVWWYTQGQKETHSNGLVSHVTKG